MYKVIFEIYGALFTVNAFLGIFQYYYLGAFPNNVFRNIIDQQAMTIVTTPDTSAILLNATLPLNSTGSPIEWVVQSAQNFAGVLAGLLDFVNFIAGGFIGNFLTSLGLPGVIVTFITVVTGLYTLYAVIVLITNRGQ